MRLLLFSDLHCDEQAAVSLVKKSAGVDLVIGAGDFATCRHGIEICLKILREISAPAILVAGNAETPDELRAAAKCWPSATVLHGETCTLAGRTIFGLGGAIPETPFGDWSFDLSEELARAALQALPPNAILVAHSPPKGTLDLDSRGRSLGSVAIAEAVLARSPNLVVCGHIHASGGKEEKLGKSRIVNAGPEGVVLSLP